MPALGHSETATRKQPPNPYPSPNPPQLREHHSRSNSHFRYEAVGAKRQISQHFRNDPNLVEEKEEEEEEEEGVALDTFGAGITEGGGADKGNVEEEVVQALDPARHAFSRALREFQNRRRHGYRDYRCGIQEGDALVDSMKKSSAVSTQGWRSGACPSPGAPSYRHGSTGFPKGWSSERVPLPAGSGRRNNGNNSSMSLVRFGNGRTLPSKWEDAEKWICSPVSIEAVGLRHHSALPLNHRRPKSKSGPVGSLAGIGSTSYTSSPLVTGFNDVKARNFAANSPFNMGVLLADRGGCCSSMVTGMSGGAGIGGGGRSSSTQSEQSMVLSASMHGWSDMVESSCSFPSSHDEKIDRRRDTSTAASPEISRKDVATQMSPGGSSQSSPRDMHSPPPAELQGHFSKLEVRDVQVDDQVTVTRWSKKQVARGLDKGSTSIVQWKKKTVESRGSAWEVTEIEKAKCLSKLKREEANITAWENLQKAKAEAEIRKLEMKLEKKRSSSMDKILTKLRSAQRKAQEMRNVVRESQTQLAALNTKQTVPFRRASQFGYLSGCFSCHAF